MPLKLDLATDPHAFDAVVRDLPITSPLQGWGYGEARRVLGQAPMRYFIRDGSRTVGAVQLLRKPLVAGMSSLYAPRGPALERADLLPDVAGALRAAARPGDLYLKAEVPVPYPEGERGAIPEAIGPWQRAETEQPEHTILADLTRTEAELFAGLHSMARRNVRAAQKNGVVAGRDEDFEAFWAIFTATNERASLGAFPRAYYEAMLREGNRYGGEAYLVLARHEGRALAGGFFLAMGEGTAYLFGGSVRDDREGAKDVKAPDAFYWNAMLDARARGYKVFDFWGIPRDLSEEKHSFGVYRMKLKFSDQTVWYPAYQLALSPLAPAVVKALRWRKDRNNLRRRGTTQDVL